MPLRVLDLLVGAGDWAGVLGRVILVLVNLASINLAAVATFLLQHVRPRTWWEAEQAHRATQLAVAMWVELLIVLTSLVLLEF